MRHRQMLNQTTADEFLCGVRREEDVVGFLERVK